MTLSKEFGRRQHRAVSQEIKTANKGDRIEICEFQLFQSQDDSCMNVMDYSKPSLFKYMAPENDQTGRDTFILRSNDDKKAQSAEMIEH